MHNITPLRSYRCTLIPDTLPDAQVEAAASAGMLKAVRLKAPNANGRARAPSTRPADVCTRSSS